jgi:hypothetical protein
MAHSPSCRRGGRCHSNAPSGDPEHFYVELTKPLDRRGVGLERGAVARMVARTKQGNHARYSISDPRVFELCDQVCGGARRQLAELDAILHA